MKTNAPNKKWVKNKQFLFHYLTLVDQKVMRKMRSKFLISQFQFVKHLLNVFKYCNTDKSAIP